MYATCLFCNHPLGRNETLEQFPVGRRLAYDEKRGRLWVICPHCARWNLSPLETRWEAIEEAERRFRDTRIRIATDNIGLARMKEGLELVRIGKPPRLELAGWRYGDQFGKRRRRNYAIGGVGFLAALLPLAGPLGAGGVEVFLALAGSMAYSTYSIRKTDRDQYIPSVFLNDGQNAILPLSKFDTHTAKFVAAPDSSGWRLSVKHRVANATSADGRFFSRRKLWGAAEKPTILRGESVHRALASMLPSVNSMGGSARKVRDAIGVVEATSTLKHLIHKAATISSVAPEGKAAIGGLPAPMRLALEMVLHDDDEQRAMDGELAELERRWRDAENIAAIADSLLISPKIQAGLDRLKK